MHVFIGVAGVALAVLVAVAVAVAVIRRWRRPMAGPLATVPGPGGLAQAVAAGRSALHQVDGDRAAILACYAAMESALGRRGLARGRADTPSEHLHRATSAGLVGAHAARDLLAVFYRARFSDHPVYSTDRQTAEQVLAKVSGRLEGAE